MKGAKLVPPHKLLKRLFCYSSPCYKNGVNISKNKNNTPKTRDDRLDFIHTRKIADANFTPHGDTKIKRGTKSILNDLSLPEAGHFEAPQPVFNSSLIKDHYSKKQIEETTNSRVDSILSIYANDTNGLESDYILKRVINGGIQSLRFSLTAGTFQSKELKKLTWDKASAEEHIDKLEDRIRKKLVNLDPKFIRDINAAIPNTKATCTIKDFIDPSTDNLRTLIQQIAYNKFPSSLSTRLKLTTANEQFRFVFESLLFKELMPTILSSTPAQKLTVDISNPPEWFPNARKMRRKIIMHVGPTNSGKTYNALKKLKSSSKGYYAGPLRLLAREIYERFQDNGIRCNLITGEEIIADIDQYGNPAGISSGTIEMIDLNTQFDVVVLDEIQMISDEFRGWAWTQALLGVNAKEIHLCGEASAVNLVKKIAAMTNDEVEVNNYERLGSLIVQDKPMHIKNLKKGDCVVAFSKNKILEYKTKIETRTNLKCGVVYGALPPETRSTEAFKFNTGIYDVLVASDAIGMGLNLKINRVVFHTSLKYDGKDMVPLSSSQIKQIGGRAGRFKVANTTRGTIDTNSPNLQPDSLPIVNDTTTTMDNSSKRDPSIGYVTAFKKDVLADVAKGMAEPMKHLTHASFWPPDSIWAQYISEFPPGTSLLYVLQVFHQEYKNTSFFQISDMEPRLEIAKLLTKVDGLLISDQLLLSTAPGNSSKNDYLIEESFVSFMNTIKNAETKNFLKFKDIPINSLKNDDLIDEEQKLKIFEEMHKIMLLFLWLGYRYPTFFVDRDSVNDLKELCKSKINEELQNLKLQKQISSPYRRR